VEEAFLSAQYCSDAALRCRRLFLGNSLFPSSLRRRSEFPCSAQPDGGGGKSADDKSAGRCLWLLREVSSCRSRATWLRYTRTFLRSISTCAMPQRFFCLPNMSTSSLSAPHLVRIVSQRRARCTPQIHQLIIRRSGPRRRAGTDLWLSLPGSFASQHAGSGADSQVAAAASAAAAARVKAAAVKAAA
jgi:hypothetical protein